MPIKRFYIKGNGNVTDVGLRPSLVTLGLAYDLKVATRNLYEENKVEVIVSGSEEGIKRFWEHVKKQDIRPVKDEKGYSVTELQPYEGMEPDWAYQVSASLMEQIYKGISRIEGVNKVLDYIKEGMAGVQETLKGIDEKFGTVAQRFGIFSDYAKKMSEKLTNMDEKLGGIDEKLDSLPERIAKAISKRE